METQIQSLHFTADQKLQMFVFEQTDKLEKTFNRIEACNVTLRLDKNDKHENKVVEIYLSVPGKRLFACERSETFEIAVHEAVGEIKRQLNNYKIIIHGHNNLVPE